MSFTKSFEHKQKLLDAALEEFNAYGILDKAGMSKGQFYYHFKNKEALYFALMELGIEKKLEYFASLNLLADSPKDIFDLFKTQLRYGIALAIEHAAIYKLR